MKWHQEQLPAWQINHHATHCILRTFREKVWEERDIKNTVLSRLGFRWVSNCLDILEDQMSLEDLCLCVH